MCNQGILPGITIQLRIWLLKWESVSNVQSLSDTRLWNLMNSHTRNCTVRSYRRSHMQFFIALTLEVHIAAVLLASKSNRQSLRLATKLLQLHQTLTAVTSGLSQLCSRSWFHRCRRRPTLFRGHLAIPKVGNGTPQLHRTPKAAYYRYFTAAFTDVVPVAASPPVTRQSLGLVTEILQLHRTRKAAYSRYFTAAFTDVVHIAASSPVTRQSVGLVTEILQLYRTLTV